MTPTGTGLAIHLQWIQCHVLCGLSNRCISFKYKAVWRCFISNKSCQSKIWLWRTWITSVHWQIRKATLVTYSFWEIRGIQGSATPEHSTLRPVLLTLLESHKLLISDKLMMEVIGALGAFGTLPSSFSLVQCGQVHVFCCRQLLRHVFQFYRLFSSAIGCPMMI